jgi:hypothetical protein
MALSDWYQDGDTMYNRAAPTYAKGYLATDDATGDSIGSAAKAGGSAMTTLVSAIMGNRAQQKQKKITKMQREGQRRNYLSTINQSLLDEGEGDESFRRGLGDAQSEMSAAGLADSSAKQDMTQQAKHQNALRIWALRKQRADATYGYQQGQKIQHLQDQIARIQQQEAIIGASIDTAISVASIVCDRRVKREFGKINPFVVLEGVMRLPMSTWRYEWEKESQRHLGPMAQDWREMIGYGWIDESVQQINAVDAFGVALTAIQALGEMVSKQAVKIQELEKKVMKHGR